MQVSHLQPLRVMAAPPQVLQCNTDGKNASLMYGLSWTEDGRAVVLKYGAQTFGSIAVQCP